MTENFRSTIGFARDTTGPALSATVADGYAASNLVSVSRRVRTSATRRDPHRTVVDAVMPCSAYALRHDWDLTSDTTNLIRAIEGVSDAGRGEAITGGRRWRIGKSGSDPVRFDCILQHVDGSHYEARKCLFTDWTITAERRSAVRCETTLNARELTTDDSSPTLAALPSGGRGVGPESLSYDFDGDTTGGMFSFVIGFQREAEAAGFSEAGVASAWAGALTPDIAGRMICRADPAVFDEAFRDEMRGSLAFTLALDGATLTITMGNVIVKATSRVHVDANLYEYALDFAAIQSGEADAAVIELVTS